MNKLQIAYIAEIVLTEVTKRCDTFVDAVLRLLLKKKMKVAVVMVGMWRAQTPLKGSSQYRKEER